MERSVDARIREEVAARLAASRWADLGALEVRAASREVTLAGVVGDAASRRVAVEIAHTVRGVRAVHDRIVLRADSDAPVEPDEGLASVHVEAEAARPARSPT